MLQVHPRAEAEVIRAAYRTLARKYHPDHGGDPARMIAADFAGFGPPVSLDLAQRFRGFWPTSEKLLLTAA
ncbi:MAG: DnaJ domain-containing protein [Candidatus Limnocylindrales bacterium]